MNIIVETNIGHEYGDLFSLLYLGAIGADVRLLLVDPGYLNQLAIIHFVCKELEWDIPVCSTRKMHKVSSSSIHHDLLRRYGYSVRHKFDTYVPNKSILITKTIQKYRDITMLALGPPRHINNYFSMKRLCPVSRLTIPTYNMNDHVEYTQNVIRTSQIEELYFVGNNICNTIELDNDMLSQFQPPKNRASELFMEVAKLYLAKRDSRKFRDPLATFLHLRPEYGTWIQGIPYNDKTWGRWGTRLTEGHSKVLVDVDRGEFWSHLTRWE